MSIQIKLLWIIPFLSCIFLTTARNQKSFEILKFESCSEFKDLPMAMTLKKIKNADSNRTLELSLTVKKKLQSNIVGSINLWKCDSIGSPDSCEYYVKDLKVRKFCQIMKARDQAWTPIIDQFKPPLSCPFDPQFYRTEIPLTQKVLYYFPVAPGIWKARGFLHSHDGQMIFCLDFHARVIQRRT